MTIADETWVCPAHPFGHAWDDTGLRCSGCDAERTAAETIASLAGSHRGWSVERAERLAAAHRAEVLRDELQAVLTESPCTHDASDDEHPTCPTIRVHRDDAERFAAMVDMLHELRTELDMTIRAKQENDERFQIMAAEQRERANKAEDERDELKEQLLTAQGDVASEALRAEQGPVR
ncbi:hypothetical protein ACH4TX_42150 [Streptomyces sp. NPDC021098]|uniref:hypothetical protein n=1 Tax=unclassified Streptomyces TaxID=2593676 RepID=UPI00379D4A9B